MSPFAALACARVCNALPRLHSYHLGSGSSRTCRSSLQALPLVLPFARQRLLSRETLSSTCAAQQRCDSISHYGSDGGQGPQASLDELTVQTKVSPSPSKIRRPPVLQRCSKSTRRRNSQIRLFSSEFFASFTLFFELEQEPQHFPVSLVSIPWVAITFYSA